MPTRLAVHVLHRFHIAHHRAHLRDNTVLRFHVHTLIAPHLTQNASILAHAHDRLHATHRTHIPWRAAALGTGRRDDEGRAEILAQHEDVIGFVEVQGLRGEGEHQCDVLDEWDAVQVRWRRHLDHLRLQWTGGEGGKQHSPEDSVPEGEIEAAEIRLHDGE